MRLLRCEDCSKPKSRGIWRTYAPDRFTWYAASRLLKKRQALDWTDYDLVEVDPENVGGQPVVKGTRVPAEVVLINEDYGRTPEQTHSIFPTLAVQTIHALLAFAHSHEPQIRA